MTLHTQHHEHCPCYPITGSCCDCEPPKHEDDSYGSCVICRSYVPHTDEEIVLVPWPCAAAREALRLLEHDQ